MSPRCAAGGDVSDGGGPATGAWGITGGCEMDAGRGLPDRIVPGAEEPSDLPCPDPLCPGPPCRDDDEPGGEPGRGELD